MFLNGSITTLSLPQYLSLLPRLPPLSRPTQNNRTVLKVHGYHWLLVRGFRSAVAVRELISDKGSSQNKGNVLLFCACSRSLALALIRLFRQTYRATGLIVQRWPHCSPKSRQWSCMCFLCQEEIAFLWIMFRNDDRPCTLVVRVPGR
jgi:hypothetical protein